MTYTLLRSRGWDTTYNYSIYLYPNTRSERYEADNYVLDAVTHFADQLYDAGAITSYRIRRYDYYPELPAGNVDDFYTQFDEYLRVRDLDTDWWGSHLALCDRFSGGLAAGGDADGWTAFDRGRPCVAGIDTYASYYMNTAIQEAAHPAINENHWRVQQMIYSDEHQLGMIYGNNYASPMVSGYGWTTSRYGDCASSYRERAWTTNITDCTRIGVHYTARD